MENIKKAIRDSQIIAIFFGVICMMVAIIFIVIKDNNEVPLIFSIAFFANYLILFAFESRLKQLEEKNSKANEQRK